MAKRILLVNKFYYNRGGDCIVTMNTEALLRSKGYEVAVFAMDYFENTESPWSGYFASEVYFSGGMKDKIAALKRTLGMGDINESFNRILDDFKPDVVHLNNIHSYLSPVLAQIAKKRGIRVVWTLHDYKLLCPAYTCLREGKICELCFKNKNKVLSKRCMKGSLSASGVAWLEAKKWSRKKLESNTDAFICPSAFMAQKMEQGGYDKAKLNVLCNFVDPEKLEQFKANEGAHDGGYYCYVGRLSKEKGVETLLKAAMYCNHELIIAGGGSLETPLRQKYGKIPNIKFLGHLDAAGVTEVLNGAKFAIAPSEWYENNPLSVIEALCAGTPVIGAEMGGIPELIDATNGFTFESGNYENLVTAIEEAFNRDWDYAAIKKNAIERFSPEAHYQKLTEIYGK